MRPLPRLRNAARSATNLLNPRVPLNRQSLVQTGKATPRPIVLVGRAFWEGAVNLPLLAEEGMIAGIAPRHIGFMGGSGDLKALAGETGPAIAEMLKNDAVDAAIFTAG